MSALTVDNVAELARQRLGWVPSNLPRLKVMVPLALKSLALKIARRSDFENLRKPPINVNCINGVIAIPSPAILLQALLETGLLILDGKTTKAAPNYHDLDTKLPADVYRWTLLGGSIVVKDLVTGAFGTVNKAGTLTANYLPTLLELPDQYDEELTEEVCILATGKVEKSTEPSFTGKDDGLNVNLNS